MTDERGQSRTCASERMPKRAPTEPMAKAMLALYPIGRRSVGPTRQSAASSAGALQFRVEARFFGLLVDDWALSLLWALPRFGRPAALCSCALPPWARAAWQPRPMQ